MLVGLMAHQIDVPSSRIVIVVMIAVGVGIVRVLHAQFISPDVHGDNKIVNTSGNSLGQSIAGFIGGGEQNTVEEIQNSELFSRLDIHGGAARADALVEMFRYGNHLIQGEFTTVYGLQSQQGGHNFGDAGGVTALMGILFVENFTVIVVYQEGGRGLHMHVVQDSAAAPRGCRGEG